VSRLTSKTQKDPKLFEKIQQDRAFLESVFDRIPGTIYIHDLVNDVNLYRSWTLKKILGLEESEKLNTGKGIRSLVHPDDVGEFNRAAKKLQLLEDNMSVQFNYRMEHANGKWLWFRSEEYVYERDSNGKPIKCLGYTSDLTSTIEQQQQLNQLNQVNEFLLKAARILSQPNKDYKSVLQELAKNISVYLNAVCDISILKEEDGIIKPEALYHPDKEVRVIISKLFAEMVVRKGQGMVGSIIESGNEILINDVPDKMKIGPRAVSEKIVPRSMMYVPLQGSQSVLGSLNITRLVGEGELTEFETNQIRRLGEYVSLFVENALLKEQQKQEIEERKKVESKLERTTKILERSEADIRATLNAIPIYISRISTDLRYRFLNDAYHHLGQNPRKMEGRYIRDVIGKEAVVKLKPQFDKVLMGETVTYEHEGTMADGAYHYFNVALAPDYSENGEVIGFYSCSIDMTTKVLAEHSANLTQDRLESLSLNSGDAFFFHDVEQNILDVNQVATEMLGYTREEFLTMKAYQIDPVWKGKLYQRFLDLLEVNLPQTFDTKVFHKDGTEVPVEVRFVKRIEGNHIYIQSLMRDRTDKRDQELKLQRSEEHLRLIFDNVEDHIAILNEDGIFESINKTSKGLEIDDVVGTSVYDFSENSDRAEELRMKFEELKNTGHSFELSGTYIDPDGVKSIYSRKFIGIFHGKKFFKAILIIRDITAERDREHSVMNAVLQGQEQERKRLGAELHDGIGQVLSAIALQVSQIRQEVSENDVETITADLSKLNSNLQEAIREVRNISHDLMPEVLESFGLKEAINQTCSNLHDRSGISVKFNHVDLEPRYDQLLEVNLYRILQELLNNIQKHAVCAKVFVSLIDHGDSLNLTVEDDGVGFNIHGPSNGIGLTNVISRVNSMNGQIDIESAEKSGTLVNIDVPKTPK
jgi:PAS domain S-box-containing protein